MPPFGFGRHLSAWFGGRAESRPANVENNKCRLKTSGTGFAKRLSDDIPS
ncbi:TPA: hypothetical protein AABQ72_001874 [Neisseria gonorrhoeae]